MLEMKLYCCAWVLCWCYALYLQSPEEGVKSHRPGVTDCCELLLGITLGPLDEQLQSHLSSSSFLCFLREIKIGTKYAMPTVFVILL